MQVLPTISEDLLIASGAVYKRLRKGEVIFSEGAHCLFYHQLVSGSVRWMNTDEHGGEFVQSFILPGECFGELPLFDDGPYVSSAIANAHSVIIRLRKETFLQLIAEHSDVHLRISRLIVKRLRYKFFIIKSIARASPVTTIVELLQYLKAENRHLDPASGQLLLTRQQVADMLGLRVETVIRCMLKMKHAGLISLENGKVFLP